MNNLQVSRTQRLRTLENEIRTNFEGWVKTGFALKEIRDDHLFEEAGYKTWTEYQSKRLNLEFGIDGNWANKIIQASILRAKIKGRLESTPTSEKNEWNVTAARPIGWWHFPKRSDCRA